MKAVQSTVTDLSGKKKATDGNNLSTFARKISMVSASTSPAPHPTQSTLGVYRITSSRHEEQLNKELLSH